ncbi:MAG TPA: maleylpyruvate isomerase N-terminal domain-containing protein [Acidimicrobiales bacterium]
MTPADHVEAVERELAALHDAVAANEMTAAVPTCDGWAVLDLATHVSQFCGFWAHVLCEGTGRGKADLAEPAGPDAVADWLKAAGDHLVGELRATPPQTPVWTWYEPDQTAAFVARRAAHELAVHRYDAQSARGSAEPIDAPLAADGIDELVGPLLLTRPRTGLATGQTIHVHGTDVDGAEWLLTLLPDAIDVLESHAKGDLALRGAVSDLELLLYGRPPLGEVERLGDPAALDAWYREFRF